MKMTRIDGLPCIEGHIIGVVTSGRDVRSGTKLHQWECSCSLRGRPTKRLPRARAGAVCHVARAARAAEPAGES